MTSVLRIIMLSTAVVTSAPVLADPVMAMSPMLMVGTTGVMAANDANERNGARRPSAHDGFSAGFRRGQIDARGAQTRLAYEPSQVLRKQAEAGVLDRLGRKDPKAAKALGAQLARQDFAKVFAGLVAPFGLRDDDVADIMTAYTALGYLIVSGAPDPSRTAVQSLRGRVAAHLAEDPQFSGPARGRLGEEIKLLFVTLHAGWQAARRDGSANVYAANVQKLFAQQAGVDLRRVTLTEQGFAAR